MMRDAAPKSAVSGFTQIQRTGTEVMPRASPKKSAGVGERRLAGSGLMAVRRIRRSVSRSSQQLSALAPATTCASAPRATRIVTADAWPGASHMPPAAVSTTIRVMRGLVRDTSSRTVESVARGRAERA